MSDITLMTQDFIKKKKNKMNNKTLGHTKFMIKIYHTYRPKIPIMKILRNIHRWKKVD